MRIERLSLEFFGQFSGKVFDFGKATGQSDFHVIYGPNEAGKTTTMEAYLRLLYGFPNNEPYAFLHQRENLRVSGLLELGSKARCFTRLPSRRGNLRGEADAILPEAAIAAHLGGLSMEDYRNLLCLDDKTIEKGGEDIANARGDIGRLLFSAAAGVADLTAVLDQARKEADDLYRKRASKTRVADLKRELSRVEQSIRETDVNAHAWRRMKDALAADESREALARKACDDLRTEQARNAALRRVLPELAELDRLVASVAEHVDYPDRLDIQPEDLITMKTLQGQAEAEAGRLREEIERAGCERASLVLDAARLALSGQLDDLDMLRSRMQTAVHDLPRRQRACDEASADMERIARELGAGDGCDASRLVTTPAQIAILEELRDRMRAARQALQAGAGEIDRLERRLVDARRVYGELREAPPAASGLIDVLQQFEVEALAPEIAAAKQAIAASDEAMQDALAALAVGSKAFCAVPACPVDGATALMLAEQHAELLAQLAREEELLAEQEEDAAVAEAQIDRLTSGSGIVDQATAAAARSRRDALWQTHRAALTAESADRFALAMQEVDDIDAARLAHAAELGELRKLGQDLAATGARIGKTRQRVGKLQLEAAAIAAKVANFAAAIGLPALGPAAWSQWVARRETAAAANQRRERVAGQYREVLDQAERLRKALEPLVMLETPSFETALTAAWRLAGTERAYQDELRSAFDAVKNIEVDLEQRRQDQLVLEGADKQASAAWHAELASLFGDLLAPELLAGALGQLRELREHEARRQEAMRRIAAMEEDQRQFARAVTRLGTCFDIQDEDPLKIFTFLQQMASEAATDKSRYEELGARIAKDTVRLKELEAQLEDIDRRVADIGAIFPARSEKDTLDALRRTVGFARDVLVKRARIGELEGRILAELSVSTIEEARELLRNASAAELEARTRSLESDLKLAESELSEATVNRAHAERNLAAITGGSQVAEWVEQQTTLHLEIEEALTEYLELELGLRLADEAIRRYRDRHRSDMLSATERAFAELTNGAYRRLQTQPEGTAEMLLAIDAGGTPKAVDKMSKGTRFQLYLALRAAAYEQMVAQGVQLPFFCDDIFETFDEDRTCAACRLMERIGRSGQAIYLTHHRHVVDIAREVCDTQPIIHEL